MKRCVDCKYYEGMGGYANYCERAHKLTYIPDVVRGRTAVTNGYLECYDERKAKRNSCGPEAKFFEGTFWYRLKKALGFGVWE